MKRAKMYVRFAENVRNRLAELDWTQAQLAKKAKLTQPMISHIVTGFSVPSAQSMQRISTALRSNLDEMIS